MDDRPTDGADWHVNTPSDLERQPQPQSHIDPPPFGPQSSSPDRPTSYLDGLRGLAAFFVLIQHNVGGFDLNVHDHGFGENGNYYFASLPFVRILFNGGNAAVAIFFVLSGYVLSRSPLGQLRNGKLEACARSLVSATVRRPIRLYIPPLGVTLMVAVLWHVPWGMLPQVPWYRPQPTVFVEILHWAVESVKFFNPFRTHGSNQGWFVYSLVVWTIPIELKGSVLVWGLIALSACSGAPLWLCVVALSAAVAVLLQFAYWTMACFIAGLVLAYVDVYALDVPYLSRKHLSARGQGIIWHVLFVVGYYLLCQPAHAGDMAYSLDTPGWHNLTLLVPKVYGNDQYYRFWQSYGAVCMVYAALRIRWLQSLLNARPLRYLGKVSFVLYLIHLPVFAIVGDRVARMLGQGIYPGAEETWWDNRLHVPDVGPACLSTRYLVNLAIVIPVCLVAADIGTKVLDEPSVVLGKRFVQKIGLADRSAGGWSKAETEGSVHLPLRSE